MNRPKEQTYFGERVKIGAFNLSREQAISVPKGLRHHLSIVPSTSQPAFGSYFILDLKDKGVQIANLSLSFTLPEPLTTGLTYNSVAHAGGANSTGNFSYPRINDGTYALSPTKGTQQEQPYLVPAQWWTSRIEIVMNNQIIDTLYPAQQFINSQIFSTDTDRLSVNNAQGNYSNIKQRQNRTIEGGAEFILALKSMFDQTKISLLANSHEVQLRVFLRDLKELVNIPLGDNASPQYGNLPAWTGTPTQSGLTCSIHSTHTKLHDTGLQLSRLQDMSKFSHHHIFHDVRLHLANITSLPPNSTTSIVLTSIVGKVAYLKFVIQPVSGITNGDNCFKFQDAKNFELLSSTGENIVGGQPITSVANRKLLEKISQSSYQEEFYGGSSLSGGEVADNGANIWIWSFSADPVRALKEGLALGSHQFQGNEVLRITNGPVAWQATQIQVFGYTESVLEQTASTVKKIAL